MLRPNDVCLALEEQPEPRVLTPQQVPGCGRAWSRAFPAEDGQASLPFHLVDGSFQAAQADAELQPPQEVIRCGDQDMELLIQEAIKGSGFSQMAPGRERKVREGPDAAPPQHCCPAQACPRNSQ